MTGPWEDYKEATTESKDSAPWEDYAHEATLPDIDNKEAQPSKLESLVRGTAQGATLGTADELTGAGETALDQANKVLSGESPDQWSDIVKKYQQHRNESRQAYEAAEKANPKTYLTGDIVGGIGGALAGGEVLGGLGAAGEGAEALGTGAKILRGTGIGAAAGGAAGLGTSNVELTGNGPINTTQLAKDVGSGALLGGVVGAAAPAIGAAGSKLGSVVAETNPGKSFLRGMNGEVINGEFPAQVGQKISGFSSDYSNRIQEYEKGLASLKSQIVKNSEDPIDVNQARATIEDSLNANPTDIGDYNTNKNKILAEVNKAFSGVTEDNGQISLREGEILKQRLEKIKQLSIGKDDSQIQNALSQGQSIISEAQNASPALADVNKNLINTNAARNSIGIGSDFGSSPIDFNMNDPRQYKLGQAIYSSANEGSTGAKTSAQFQDMINSLKLSNPDLANELEQNIPKFQEDASLASSLDPNTPYTKSGLAKRLLIKGANPAGRAVGAVNKVMGNPYVSPLFQTGGALAEGAYDSAVVAGKTYGAKDVRNANSSQPKANYLHDTFSNQTPEQMKQIADQLRMQRQTGIANKVQEAADNPDNTLARAQADFVMQQNPLAKKQVIDNQGPSDEDIGNAIESLRSQYNR